MEQALRILHLEDEPADSEVVDQLLRRGGLQVQVDRVDSLAGFQLKLEHQPYALILSDYTLPGVDVREALTLARRLCPETPFIFVSGTLGEDTAIEMLKLGASDYVLKQRLARLMPAVRRALQEAEELARRKRAEEELASMAQFPEENPSPVLRIEQDGQVLYANHAARTMLAAEGCQPGATVPDALRAAALIALQKGTPEEFELPCRDGRVFSFTCMAPPGKSYVNFYGRDVTEARQAEAQVRLQAAALEAAANAIFITNASGMIIWANTAFSALTGYSGEEVIGRNPRFLKSGMQDEAFYRGLWETINRGEVWRGELVNRRKDGTLYMEEMTITPVCGDQRRISHFIAIKHDITERKRAEETLRESEARFRAFIESNVIGILFGDVDGRVYDCNDELARIIGRSRQEVLEGQVRWTDITLPEDLPLDAKALAEAQATGRCAPYEKQYIRPDSTRVPVVVGYTLLEPERRRSVAFILDISERKRMEDALREADRRKDEFLAMLSHELRNPLAPVRYAVEMLNMAGIKEPFLQRQRDVIARQIGHMAHLLDDLLDVSRITCGKIELKRERLDLREAVAQAVEVAQTAARERGQELSLRLPPGPLLLEGDPVRLNQVISNLLSNAVRYTPKGGQITVEAERETSQEQGVTPMALLRVRDNGIGITPELLPHIFELFRQAERPLDRTQGGLGIGLTLVQRLVAMHGGAVEARSGGPGQGSEFMVHLPLLAENAPAPSPPPRSEAVGAPAGQQHACRVLIIEDNHDSADSLRDLLELLGHTVQLSYDGPTGLERAADFLPDVILLDIGLPGMNGYEVARQIKGNERLQTVFLVALTGYGQDEDRARTSEAGFDRHLTKPVDLTELQSVLHRACPDPSQ